ncbi:hypothetical protein B7P43_G07048 [Cryptotermes secundus]|uniref:Uncharacterized protein n=1 Tax=Cryptotermes secundus TaxID=105785 RepID=A0A2J7QLF5_9NEOP|nr:hypothetical protein B7P43_G07048 [Cryptotermes secundus]
MNEDDPDQRLEYCKWFEDMVREDEEFAGKVIWSDVAQFKMNSTVNCHNCVDLAPVNPHVHGGKEVNLPGVNVQSGLSSRDERFYLQHGALPHYHRDVRAYLDNTLPGRWIGRRGAIEYPPWFPDLTPLDFYLWGTLKDEVYRQKPATLNTLQETIEVSCAAIKLDTLTAIVRSAVWRHQRCLAADGGHFEHVQ